MCFLPKFAFGPLVLFGDKHTQLNLRVVKVGTEKCKEKSGISITHFNQINEPEPSSSLMRIIYF